jgi:hypothetical protein
MDRSLNFMEIKEIKKSKIYTNTDNNFGEIEMCLNKQLTYNMKIKSRICELFVLRKDDFLRLSVNFKEYIENFLKIALFKFLKLHGEITQIINGIEEGLEPHEIMLGINNADDLEEGDQEDNIVEDDRESYYLATTMDNKTQIEKCQTKESRGSKQSLEKIDGIYY